MSPRTIFFLAVLATACARPEPAARDQQQPGAALRDSAAAPAKPAQSEAAPAEIAVTELKANQLPPGIPHGMETVLARRWTDRLGDNVLLFTRAGRETCDQDMCGTTLTLDGYHYLVSGSQSTQLWHTTDAVRTCELDMTLDVHPGSIAITDLDHDGTAETTYVYAMACRGDVSPLDMKLIMHEGAAKYAIRGSTDLPGKYLGGEGFPARMSVDPSFGQAPAEFRSWAIQHWRQFEGYDRWTPSDMEGEDHTGH